MPCVLCCLLHIIIHNRNNHRYFVWIMRCSTMEPRIFSGPNGQFVQNCRDMVQSNSNKNPSSRTLQPYIRPECVSQLEKFPKHEGSFLTLSSALHGSYLVETPSANSASEATTEREMPSSTSEVVEYAQGRPLFTSEHTALSQSQSSIVNYSNPTIQYTLQRLKSLSTNGTKNAGQKWNAASVHILAPSYDVDDHGSYRLISFFLFAMFWPMLFTRYAIKFILRVNFKRDAAIHNQPTFPMHPKQNT
jgi:hypothetical protein